ncbi:MAG: CopG family transcriptional regulator [Henriciella sp.]|uniref:DUF411 domain-containing protein n=1 Tax=Hyphococcus sp. TaxID=2038636 RepID=UPI000C401F48|nr:CopG family transcriptional regulator [Henriciella sp.]|tara:strand:+ start:659 stop:1159 length:501 start_codon:yes stop_codon:yes gene_type:complete
MSRILFAGAGGMLVMAAVIVGWMLFSTPAPASAQTVTVHKTPWCGCCTAWVDHLRDNGFDVVVKEEEDLRPVRARLGVPDPLMSCHTGEVDGYAVEGHVPAREIRRLLSERPAADGLSVPGMPQGSPGMETPNPPDRYDVLLFSGDSARTYATYEGPTQLATPDVQ